MVHKAKKSLVGSSVLTFVFRPPKLYQLNPGISIYTKFGEISPRGSWDIVFTRVRSMNTLKKQLWPLTHQRRGITNDWLYLWMSLAIFLCIISYESDWSHWLLTADAKWTLVILKATQQKQLKHHRRVVISGGAGRHLCVQVQGGASWAGGGSEVSKHYGVKGQQADGQRWKGGVPDKYLLKCYALPSGSKSTWHQTETCSFHVIYQHLHLITTIWQMICIK